MMSRIMMAWVIVTWLAGCVTQPETPNSDSNSAASESAPEEAHDHAHTQAGRRFVLNAAEAD